MQGENLTFIKHRNSHFIAYLCRTHNNQSQVTMKTFLQILIPAIAVLYSAIQVNAAADPNIVIEQLTDRYKLVSDKEGKLVRIEESCETTFRAKRTAGKAMALAFYSEDIKITKATGGTVGYDYVDRDGIFFDDSKLCYVAVELKKPGATAKATINSTILRPEFFSRILLYESYDIENAQYIFEIPTNLSDRYKIVERNVPSGMLKRTEETKGDKLVITFSATGLKTPKRFSDEPSRSRYYPQLLILGQFANPTEVYSYLRTYIQETDPQNQSVADKTREITAGCTTDAERIAAITRFVHDNIRYVAVENGELGQRPDLPSEVLRKSFGDCKGSASLIKAMLCAAGIDGRLVWIGTDDVGNRYSEYPVTSAGNHMIAAADSILFIDGTARQTPPFKVPFGIQGCEGLVEDGPDKCIVATVPTSSPLENMNKSDLRLTIDPDGTLCGEGSLTITNGLANSVKSLIEDTAPAQRANIYARLFEICLAGSHADQPEVNAAESEIILNGKLSLGGAVKKVGDETYVDINPSAYLTKLKFDTKERESPGYYSYPMSDVSTLTFQIPDGMEACFLPEPVEIENEWLSGKISTTLSPDDNTIVRNFSIIVRPGIIPLNDLKRVNADINRLSTACSSKIGIRNSN